MKNYFVLAYYHFTHIEDPAKEVALHHAFFKGRDVKSRIYISPEGINGQMSAEMHDAEAYMEWLRANPAFKDIEFKIHHYHENVFPKLTVKVKKQLVAMDEPADLALTGEHLSAEKWKQMIASRDDNTLILDVRNDYEWRLGHFEGADLPTLEQFREFPSYARKLKEEKDLENTKVMMYCTGGIRCELYSALLKKEGFKNVFQLQGGVIKYGLEEGTKHWKGKLFVFDDRLAVPISEKETSEIISACHACETSCDVYYNCANMDCNELFLCCPNCIDNFKGCCSAACLAEEDRVRPYEKEGRPKPFRKMPKQRKEE